MTDYKDLPGEFWTPVIDFDNYLVSNHGRVWSEKNKMILKAWGTDLTGLRVTLYMDDKKRVVYTNQLVAEHFLVDHIQGSHVEHIDGDRLNCHVSNLESISAHNRDPAGLYETPPNSWARPVKVVEWGEVYDNACALADHLDTNPSNIYKCLRKERKRHLGLTYEYV